VSGDESTTLGQAFADALRKEQRKNVLDPDNPATNALGQPDPVREQFAEHAAAAIDKLHADAKPAASDTPEE
jgi:hypothetical protein